MGGLGWGFPEALAALIGTSRQRVLMTKTCHFPSLSFFCVEATFFLTSLLTFILAFYLVYLLTFSPTFFLVYLLTFFLAYILAFFLTFYLSGISSDMISDIPAGVLSGISSDSRLRYGGEHCQPELAVAVRKRRRQRT